MSVMSLFLKKTCTPTHGYRLKFLYGFDYFPVFESNHGELNIGADVQSWLVTYGPLWEKPVFGVSDKVRFKPACSAT